MNIQELNMLELNFEGMKKLLNACPNQTRSEELTKEKHEKMVKELMMEDFDDLMKFSEPTVKNIQNNIIQIFNILPMDRPMLYSPDNLDSKYQKPVYEKKFPELFFF